MTKPDEGIPPEVAQAIQGIADGIRSFFDDHIGIEELQAPRDMVNDLMADLARKFNTSKEHPLRMPQMDDALAFVDKWYPGEDAPEPGSDG